MGCGKNGQYCTNPHHNHNPAYQNWGASQWLTAILLWVLLIPAIVFPPLGVVYLIVFILWRLTKKSSSFKQTQIRSENMLDLNESSISEVDIPVTESYEAQKQKGLIKAKSCQHHISQSRSYIDHIVQIYPTQGDVGNQFKCTKCDSILICSCRKELYQRLYPQLEEHLRKIGISMQLKEKICLTCRQEADPSDNLFEYKKWDCFVESVSYMERNDPEFYKYCFGIQTGYMKDYKDQYEYSNTHRGKEAKVRVEKARSLLNKYFHRVYDTYKRKLDKAVS